MLCFPPSSLSPEPCGNTTKFGVPQSAFFAESGLRVVTPKEPWETADSGVAPEVSAT